MEQEICLIINDEPHKVSVKSNDTLLDVLRDKLGLTGTKEGCNLGECGACTVLLGGKPVSSCLTLAVSARDKEITTIEGLADGQNLHLIQRAFIDYGAIQCGFCTPGMILSTKALLEENPNPTREETKAALVGNLCRCTGYVKIVDAVLAAAEAMRKGKIT
jgi:carbon-monoxide dehydrogenase small subunit